MINNYIKIAFRNLFRNKLFAAINIAGLTLGSVCFLLILMYVFSQYQYDKHHSSGASLYRVETELRISDGEFISATVSPPIVPAMSNDFPEVLRSSRVVDPPETSHHILKWKNNSFYETKGYYVDSVFFDMFDYDWIEGDSEMALQEPYSVVITERVKRKLFKSNNAVGQVIEIDNRFGINEFKVTGVVDQSTYKSHIRPNFYMSMNSGGMGRYVRNNDQWAGGNFIHGYIELIPSANPEDLVTKLPDFLQKYGGDQFKEMGAKKILSLQPVSDIHLKSSRDNQLDVTGDSRFLNLLMLIAGFILIIACVNFMNLSTAQSLQKGVEVGVRKTIGAKRSDIVQQYYVESFLMAGISFILAIIISYYSLPLISSFLGEQVSLDHRSLLFIIGSVFCIYLLTGLTAGSYPALFLSSFNPVTAIKGKLENRKSGNGVRKSFVVLQFTISIIMIIGSIAVMNQMKYVQNKDLGFNAKQKIIVPFRTREIRSKLSAFKSEILRIPGVKRAAGARIYPGQFMAQDFNLYKEGNDINNSQNVNLIQGDEDYFNVLGIPILYGRNFSISDTSSQILINQTALRNLGIPENNAIGQRLYSEYNNQKEVREIIGVTKDYNQRSLREEIKPIIFEYRSTERSLALLIDVTLGQSENLIHSLSDQWKNLIPEVPFDYQFLDEQFYSQYKQDTKFAQIIGVFTFIAIFISCLGLFGLSTFMADRRSKEIGIRKVLGASWSGIVLMLSKDYVNLIAISLFIAGPISWYFIRQWLDGFVYRVDIGLWLFAIAGLIAVSIGLITVSFQSIKAALSNPVNSLRNE